MDQGNAESESGWQTKNPKTVKEVKELAKEFTPMALKTLAAVCVSLSRDELARGDVRRRCGTRPIAEILKPRTWNDIWAMRAEELRERDIELDEYADQFNLNDANKHIMEMK